MLSITFRQLEYVIAVAEHGGVSSAAKMINVSQPSLSVAIARLEEELGRSLFIRSGKGPFMPTAYGRGFIEDATDLLASAVRLVDPNAPPSKQRKPITVGFFEDLAPMMLAPVLEHAGRVHGEAVVVTRVDGFGPLAEALGTGQLDCAVTYNFGLDEMIDCRTLTTLSPHALVSENHPIANQASTTLSALAEEPLILADQGHSVRHMINLFRQRGLTPRIAHRAASLETMRSLAGNGFGVGVTYTLPASQQSYDGKKVVSKKITDQGAVEPVVLATNSLNELTAHALDVIETIADISQLGADDVNRGM